MLNLFQITVLSILEVICTGYKAPKVPLLKQYKLWDNIWIIIDISLRWTFLRTQFGASDELQQILDNNVSDDVIITDNNVVDANNNTQQQVVEMAYDENMDDAKLRCVSKVVLVVVVVLLVGIVVMVVKDAVESNTFNSRMNRPNGKRFWEEEKILE